MELNVIDLAGNRENGQERVSARKASGEDIRLWDGVTINRSQERRGPVRRERVRAEQALSGREQTAVRRREREPEAGGVHRAAGAGTVRSRDPGAERRREAAPAHRPAPMPQRRPASGAQRYPEQQRRAELRRPRPVRTGEPQGYDRPPARRSRAAEARARQERLRRKKIRRRKQMAARLTVLLCLAGVIGLSLFVLIRLVTGKEEKEKVVKTFHETRPMDESPGEHENNGKPFMTEDFLTVNEYSRPGEALEAVNNIFVHYTANSGTSAAQNRSYFENLATTGETSASAHFIIGYDGEIIQCIPLDEIAYAVIGRNYDSVSIECCYLQDDGKFTDKTYQSLIRLCGWLLKEYNLTPQDMRRHYDEGGKKCPLYFTEHVEEWERFKQDLDQYMTEQGSV